MNSVLKPMGVLGVLFVGSNLLAAIPEKYQTILDRNAFGLLPPPPPVAEAPQTAPPVEVKVTGFATIAGERRVYLAIPPKTPQDHYQYLSLTEGEVEAGIEVLKISEEEELVQVRNAGIEVALSLEENGFQSSKQTGAPVQAVAQGRATQGRPLVARVPAAAPAVTAAPTQTVPQSPVYNPTAASNPVRPGGTTGGVRGSTASRNASPTPVQMASYNSGMGSAPVIGGGSSRVAGGSQIVAGGTPVVAGGYVTPATASPVYGAVPNVEEPARGTAQPRQTGQPNFPAERPLDSPPPQNNGQTPRTRAEWEAYYRNMGWPSDRPLPIDVAEALSPL